MRKQGLFLVVIVLDAIHLDQVETWGEGEEQDEEKLCKLIDIKHRADDKIDILCRAIEQPEPEEHLCPQEYFWHRCDNPNPVHVHMLRLFIEAADYTG